MNWEFILTMIGVNICLIIFTRVDRNNFEKETRKWKEDINKDNKDFHGRICAIEENQKTEINRHK